MNAVRFFGLHFSDGVATFADGELGFISEEVATRLSSTMEGVPVVIDHPDDIEKAKPVGYVVKSFFNKYDGKQWCEFLITDSEGLKCVEEGYLLSNSYFYSKEKSNGHYHGIDYDFVVTDGEYEHLALVNDPRYSESIILTQSEFDEYNKKREQNIKTINSGENSMFGKIGGKNKPQIKTFNTKDFKDHVVTLPKSKLTKTINEVIDLVDSYEVGGIEASLSDYIFIDDKKVTIQDLISKIDELMEGATEEQVQEEFETESAYETENADDEEEAENEEKEEEEKTVDNKKTKNIKSKFFQKLSNADKQVEKTQTVNIMTTKNAFDLGKEKYGRKK